MHMTRKGKWIFGSVAVAVVLAGVVSAGVAQKVSQKELGGPARYLTALSTDKQVYRSGETVWVRGVILNAFDHRPLKESANAAIEVRGPKGEVVASGNSASNDAVWSFSWTVPDGLAGGEYKLKATYPWHGHPPAERKFDVRVYRAPRLKSQIVFLRDGYGPGDKVTSTVTVKRAEGGFPKGAQVTATALVDGVEVTRIVSAVDAKGQCQVSFHLPKTIERGEATMAFAIADGGVVETATKTLPILLQTLDLTLFPEGGDLASGVLNRVYFQALTPAQKPADIAGVIVDSNGKVVSQFRSEHEGRGRFDFVPETDVRYTFRVQEPSGIKKTWTLPEVKVGGVALRARDDLTRRGGTVMVQVGSARPRTVTVTLSHRERVLGTKKVTLNSKSLVEVALGARGADGVLSVMVSGERGEPLAERLLYRQPSSVLKVELRPDKRTYIPGETVKLTAIATRDGQPVSAVIGLTVTDDAVIEMTEKRDQAPQLSVMMLLEPEVKELADAHVYLDSRNPKAPRALDLLLGTQGWRRFALVNLGDFVSTHGDAARRALAIRIAPPQFLGGQGFGAGGGGMARGMAPQKGGGRVPRAPQGKDDFERDEMIPMPAAMPPPAPRPGRPADNKVAAEPMRQAAAPPAIAKEAVQGGIAKAEAMMDEQAVFREEKKARRMAPPQRVYAREYAHISQPGRRPDERTDFTETVYWNAGIRTNANTGEATVRFALNDSVTAFRVFANGFDASGALGVDNTAIKSIQPFYAEPKLPLEVTTGDTIALPVSIVNGTASTLKGAKVVLSSSLPPDARGLQIGAIPRLDLRPGERVRRIVDIAVGAVDATAEMRLDVTADPYVDIVKRTLSIKSNGFPAQLAFGGLTGTAAAKHTLVIPSNTVQGSLSATVAVYPTPLANLAQALERLIQEPNGCFEQTSSTTYPLTMAQQYFKGHTGVDAKVIASASEKLERGYQKLVGFECSDKGYEWFGENPGHEALTAYGLMHFTDMAKVRDVDAGMISRSRDWLLGQRDGKGGFSRKRRALHTWIEDQDCSNGYILWSLLESGQKSGLDKELAAFKNAANASSNSYVMALAANVFALAGDHATSKALMQKLGGKQQRNGVVAGATTSIVGSGGEALEIETTGLAVLAWLRDPGFAGQVERSMKFLADSCEGGRYGSTQSTVLALRAIVAYDEARSRPKTPGKLGIWVDGKPVGTSVAFDGNTQGTIMLPDIAPALRSGSHTVEVRMEAGAPMPYSIAVEYNALTPVSAPECKLDLDVKLSKRRALEGDLLEAIATVANRSDSAIPTPTVIVGLPGGLEPRHDQLKELVKKKTIDAYEVLGREVVLYWRGMGAHQRVSVPLSLVAAIPGQYTGPASRAYLYYTDEHKNWVDGLKVEIVPKN